MLTDAKIAALKPPATGQDEYPDHKVTGLRLRIGAGGKKTWIVRRRVGAKVLNKKLGDYPTMGLAAARVTADKLLQALTQDGSAEALERTFEAVATHWMDNVAKGRNRSWELQQRQLDLHVLPHWRDKRVATIRRADVRELLDRIEGQVAPNRVLALIRTIFRHALSRDWIENSPAEAIKPPKDETPRDRYLDMDEVKRVYGKADLLGYPFAGFIKMLFLTGQRRTEVGAMRWDDIDLEAGTWIISSQDTKAARAQLVPLSPQALAVLDQTPRLGEFVWTSNGEAPIGAYSAAKARLDKYIAGLGPALAPWRLHDIRRTAATHMVRLGVGEDIVGRVLNHAPQGVTARVYALHSYEPEKRSALNRWAAEIERAVTGKKANKVVSIRG